MRYTISTKANHVNFDKASHSSAVKVVEEEIEFTGFSLRAHTALLWLLV